MTRTTLRGSVIHATSTRRVLTKNLKAMLQITSTREWRLSNGRLPRHVLIKKLKRESCGKLRTGSAFNNSVIKR